MDNEKETDRQTWTLLFAVFYRELFCPSGAISLVIILDPLSEDYRHFLLISSYTGKEKNIIEINIFIYFYLSER